MGNWMYGPGAYKAIMFAPLPLAQIVLYQDRDTSADKLSKMGMAGVVSGLLAR